MGDIMVPHPHFRRVANRLFPRLVVHLLSAVLCVHWAVQGSVRGPTQSGTTATDLRGKHDRNESHMWIDYNGLFIGSVIGYYYMDINCFDFFIFNTFFYNVW